MPRCKGEADIAQRQAVGRHAAQASIMSAHSNTVVGALGAVDISESGAKN